MKNEVRQQDSGMCYAHRDSKAMEFFHKSVGIKIKEPGVLELATTFHRKLLWLRQLFEKKVNYKNSESILDWGHSCEAINHILKNGFCKKSKYSSSSFHYIYNIMRMFGDINLSTKKKVCADDCGFELSNEQKNEYSNILIKLTLDGIRKDENLSSEVRSELTKFVSKSFSTVRKTNFPKIVKSMERKVRNHCKKTTTLNEYRGYHCSHLFFPDAFEHENYSTFTHKYLLDSLSDRQNQPLMASICSSVLSSTKDPAGLGFNQSVGGYRCGPHAVLITGAKSKNGSCNVLIEDNYPGVCDQEKMPWVECEKDTKGKETGRYWIDSKRLAPMLISISKIEKVIKK
ncbi:MAG: hypothetical protein CME61_07195 [Halobacteriovoraceae bacterium]|nr:hypothetical protein [Halobacteriovoraceae bacterium]